MDVGPATYPAAAQREVYLISDTHGILEECRSLGDLILQDDPHPDRGISRDVRIELPDQFDDIGESEVFQDLGGAKCLDVRIPVWPEDLQDAFQTHPGPVFLLPRGRAVIRHRLRHSPEGFDT